ncbi:lasso peptide biosynthesis B2 protein [Kitasatospora sp. NPDC059722]|uniref:lasso peptide biosynthesis B2 protein n=1 Tax=Kitasatospora sp. NPDC059722 TaxID=3346925 RepID=UPI0036CFDDBC
MSFTFALEHDRSQRPPLPRRLAIRTAVGLARLLVLLPAHRLQRVLAVLSRGARPAGADETGAVRDAVLATSLAMNGLRSCLPRSVAVTLLCRARGSWPTWCVGVRTAPPFTAHAWVEAEGRLIGEKGRHDSWARLLTVAAPSPHTNSGTSGKSGESANSGKSGH